MHCMCMHGAHIVEVGLARCGLALQLMRLVMIIVAASIVPHVIVHATACGARCAHGPAREHRDCRKNGKPQGSNGKKSNVVQLGQAISGRKTCRRGVNVLATSKSPPHTEDAWYNASEPFVN